LRIQPSFTSSSFGKTSTKSQFLKSDPSNDLKPVQKDSHLGLGLVIFAGALAVSFEAFGAFKGIKHIMNPPPTKKVVELLEDKLATIKLITNRTKEAFTNHLKTATSDLSTIFPKPIFPRPFNQGEDVVDLVKLKNAGSKKELLEIEESCFNTLSLWFNKNLNVEKKSPEELLTKSNEIAECLKQKLNQSEQEAIEQIKIHSELPKDIKEKRREKNAIESFNFRIGESKKGLLVSKDNAIYRLKKDAQDLYRKYNNYSERIVESKNLETENILSSVEEKMESLVNSTLPSTHTASNSVNMDIIPSTVPDSILSNKFYQFASTITEKDYEKSIPEFVNGMGEELSLKDIQTLNNRLEIRQKAEIVNTNAFNWYNTKTKQLREGEAKISAYLENSFYNSGKNIDANNLTSQQEEQIIFALQEHAKKMGFPSIQPMMKHFSEGDKIGEYGERWGKYHKSNISNIYHKLNYKEPSFVDKLFPDLKYPNDESHNSGNDFGFSFDGLNDDWIM
jgi:hypothetical protein